MFILGLLSIDNRWKELAKALGYTSNEINTKFSPENPIEEILTDFMSRGGDDRQFIQALYEVARRLKLIPYDQMMENRENRRMESRIQGGLFLLNFQIKNHLVMLIVPSKYWIIEL